MVRTDIDIYLILSMKMRVFSIITSIIIHVGGNKDVIITRNDIISTLNTISVTSLEITDT